MLLVIYILFSVLGIICGNMISNKIEWDKFSSRSVLTFIGILILLLFLMGWCMFRGNRECF